MKLYWGSSWSAEAHAQLRCQVLGTGASFLSPPFVRLLPSNKSTWCVKLLRIVFSSWSLSPLQSLLSLWGLGHVLSSHQQNFPFILPIYLSFWALLVVLALLRCCLNTLGDSCVVLVGKLCKGFFLPTYGLDQKCWLVAEMSVQW